MLSTLLTYRTYAANIDKTLERVQQTPTVAADAKYYEENIGKVESVDDFLDDYRLYTYALKAYGLEEQISSKAFVRKVIESDLSDTASFANALADKRYRTFAEAFNFSSVTAAPVSAQVSRQLESMIDSYSEHRVRQGTTLSAKTGYFERQIAQVASVEDFVNNAALFEVAMTAIGADPALTSKSYVRDVFLGRITDDTASFSDDKFFALADKFNFGVDGLVEGSAGAINAAEVSALIHRFNVATGNEASAPAAAHETKYYNEEIALVTDVDDFVNDPRLFDYVRKAFLLPPETSPAVIANILTSAPTAIGSVISAAGLTEDAGYPGYLDRLTELRAAFDFQPNGSAPAGAQSDAARDGLIDRYFDNYKFDAARDDAEKTSRFRDILSGRIQSVADLLADTADFDTDAMEFVLTAFDIDPQTASLTKIRRVLQSDTSDPNSYVNRLGDERYEKLAAAFNFDAEGQIRAERQVQSISGQTATGTLYRESFGPELSTAKKEVITAETRKYLETVAELRTLDDFLASDTVIDYALTAYGLGEEDLDARDLRRLFTSDLGDPDSYANSLGDSRYVDFITAFNFGSDGLVKIDEGGIQSGADLLSTQNLFLMTTLEQQAGETSEGARLALYFLRQAPEAKTTLQLLADRALVEVVRTALGLPAEISQLDLDKQVTLIESRLDIADLKDPKKLDSFIARFAALYDLNNGASQSSPILGLFNGGGQASGGLLAIL